MPAAPRTSSVRLGLDFYHLGEHVHAGRRETFGEQAEAGKRWAQDVLHTVRHEGYEPFWEQLTDWRGRQCDGSSVKTPTDCCTMWPSGKT